MSGPGKPTSCKDALRRWEDENGIALAQASEVNLSFQWPPIEKMDNALACLLSCERLSLSTNMIEKVAGISSLKNLRVLSLGRNQIKGFGGLEPLGDTLEELWLSYNSVEKTKGAGVLRNLRVLLLSNNLVKEWNELARLQELPRLRELVFVGNPITEGLEVGEWRAEVAKRLPALDKLDGEPLIVAASDEASPAGGGQAAKAPGENNNSAQQQSTSPGSGSGSAG